MSWPDSRRPGGRLFAEDRTAAPDLLAIEDWLRALDGVDDLQHGDLIRRAGQAIAAADAFARGHDPGLLQLRENLGEEARRDALQLRQLPAAQRRVARGGEPEQAVEAVFNAGRQMCHNADNNHPSWIWQEKTQTILVRVINFQPE